MGLVQAKELEKLKTKMRYFPISLLIFLIIGFTSPRVTNADHLPMIYYYSAEQGGFVRESVDGSDSHLFIPFDSQGRDIEGPGWSPSGKWFVWSCGAIHFENRKVFLANSDGEIQELLSGQENPAAMSRMSWSPTDDLLFVTINQEIEHGVGIISKTVRVLIIDVEANKTLAEFNDPSAAYTSQDVFWTPNGQMVEIKYKAIDDSAEDRYFLALITPEGQLMRRPFYINDQYCFYPTWSQDGKVLYSDKVNKKLVVEDYFHNSTTNFTVPDGAIRRVEWSANGNYAAIMTSDTCADSESYLWILSLTDGDFSQVFDFKIHDNVGDTVTYSSWSPDGDAFFVLSSDGTPYIITPDRNQTVALPVNIEVWAGILRWSSDGNTVTFSGDLRECPNHLFIYDISADQLTDLNLFPENTSVRYFSYASNANYLMISRGCDEACILDMQTNTVSSVTSERRLPQSQSLSYGGIWESEWHQDSDWLFTFGFLDAMSRVIGVMNSRDSVNREIAVCTFSPSCFGWLPEIIAAS